MSGIFVFFCSDIFLAERFYTGEEKQPYPPVSPTGVIKRKSQVDKTDVFAQSHVEVLDCCC